MYNVPVLPTTCVLYVVPMYVLPPLLLLCSSMHYSAANRPENVDALTTDAKNAQQFLRIKKHNSTFLLILPIIIVSFFKNKWLPQDKVISHFFFLSSSSSRKINFPKLRMTLLEK